MIDFMLFGGFDDGWTDGRTNERTLVVLESLSRLKSKVSFEKWSSSAFQNWPYF